MSDTTTLPPVIFAGKDMIWLVSRGGDGWGDGLSLDLGCGYSGFSTGDGYGHGYKTGEGDFQWRPDLLHP